MSASDTKTDDSKLVTTDTVYVSPDGGTTDEAFPKPNVEYDFCVDVANAGELPSGSFFIRFNLSGDQDPPLDLDFKHDDGLDAGATVKAVVHFGTFPQHIISKPVFTPAQRRRNRSIVRVRLISLSIQNRRATPDRAVATTILARLTQEIATEIQQRQSHNEPRPIAAGCLTIALETNPQNKLTNG